MNRYKILIIQCVIVCLIMSCGTLGGIGDDAICFPTSKQKLEIAIDSLYFKYPEYKIPAKRESYNDLSERGYDFLESRIFHFKSHPEEMYYVTFIGDSVMLSNPNKIELGIRAINYGDDRWFSGNELSDKEKQRVLSRFDKEIIYKLEKYTKTKSYHESLYK